VDAQGTGGNQDPDPPGARGELVEGDRRQPLELLEQRRLESAGAWRDDDVRRHELGSERPR
jgi:hypothetical protein